MTRGYDALELSADGPQEAFVASVLHTPRLICVGVGSTRPELVDSTQNVVDGILAFDAEIPAVFGDLAAKALGISALRHMTAIAENIRDEVLVIESPAHVEPSVEGRRAGSEGDPCALDVRLPISDMYDPRTQR